MTATGDMRRQIIAKLHKRVIDAVNYIFDNVAVNKHVYPNSTCHCCDSCAQWKGHFTPIDAIIQSARGKEIPVLPDKKHGFLTPSGCSLKDRHDRSLICIRYVCSGSLPLFIVAIITYAVDELRAKVSEADCTERGAITRLEWLVTDMQHGRIRIHNDLV